MQEEIVATFRFMGIAAKILGNIYRNKGVDMLANTIQQSFISTNLRIFYILFSKQLL